MIKPILYCSLYAALNVFGAMIIKIELKSQILINIQEWLKFLINLKVIIGFGLIFASALVMFKALSSASFSFTIPVATGINFSFTIIMGYFIFKDKINIWCFIGFGLILLGVVLLGLNSMNHAR